MASNIVLISVLVVAMVGTAASISIFDLPNCKIDNTTRQDFLGCYENVTGVDLTKIDLTNFATPSDDDKLNVGLCIAKKENYTTADGTEIDWTRAIPLIDDIDADDSVKTALKAGMQACIDKGGNDTLSIMECNKDVYTENCVPTS